MNHEGLTGRLGSPLKSYTTRGPWCPRPVPDVCHHRLLTVDDRLTY